MEDEAGEVVANQWKGLLLDRGNGEGLDDLVERWV